MNWELSSTCDMVSLIWKNPSKAHSVDVEVEEKIRKLKGVTFAFTQKKLALIMKSVFYVSFSLHNMVRSRILQSVRETVS